MPLVIGPDAAIQAPHLLETLQNELVIARRVVSAVRIGGRRWELRLDNGIDIRLPENRIADALRRLALVEVSSKIFDRDIQVIDLRLDDRIVIRGAPELDELHRHDSLPGEPTT
jgi:cell division protein FtsQ